MRYQYHDIVAGLHGQMKIVGNQQNSAVQISPNVVNQFMQRFRPGYVDTLVGFVENQQIRLLNQGAREEQPLEFTAGKSREGRVAEAFQANSNKRGVNLVLGKSTRQRHDAAHRERQERADCKALRNVSDAQAIQALYCSFAGLDQTEYGLGAG